MDKDFKQFLAEYNESLTKLGKKPIEDKTIIRTLEDFYNREMPSDFVGYIKAMGKVYQED